MANLTYEKNLTAHLIIDPYNDFISEGGKLWDRVKTVAHTCVKATIRSPAELGYEVTMVKDATADYSDEHMHTALVTNLPNYASAIVTTQEIIGSIASVPIAAA